MPLIDMLTDISSFNYNKVGKKHDEYFTDNNATGFTPNFTREGGKGLGNTEYIIGSGNDYNFTEPKQHFGIDGTPFFTDTNQTGFTIFRKERDETEYIIGSGNDFNFKTSSTGTDFFLNTNATGFTLNRTEKDIDTDSATFAGEYIIGSSQYESLKNIKSTLATTDPEDLDSNVPKRTTIYFDNEGGISRKDYQLLSTDYARVRGARKALPEQINLGDTSPKESKDYISPKLNTPIVFSDGHLYGAAPTNVLFEDRLGDVDDEYKKFGGNAGLRASTPGNDGDANEGVIGFDSPFIIKEVGDRYDSIDFAVENGITAIPFTIVRTAEDLIRIGKWTLTAKGIIWNVNQFMLHAQSAVGSYRFFNPAGPLGSLVPFVHLPRHTDGSFTDLGVTYSDSGPPAYGTKFTDDMHEVRPPATNPVSDLANQAEDAVAKTLSIQNNNRMENLRQIRIEKGDGPIPNLHPLASLGKIFSNKEFVDPTHVVKSMKGPSGGELGRKVEDGEKLEDTHSSLITNYSNLKNFPISTGQSGVRGIDSSLKNMEQMNLAGDDVEKITPLANTVLSTEVSNKTSPVKNKVLASTYNLGRGLISQGNDMYSVGVSNQLQVPYHGQFGKLTTSLDKLPKDFIKFRIRDAVNGKWLIFPALLGPITDTVTPQFTIERYIGRPDDVHIYGGTSRTIGFDFKVAAFSKQEIPIIQEKMNYLMGLGYPTFKKMLEGDSEERPVAPYIYLTIGDMFNNTPGYFDSIAIATEENGNWEIDEGFQIPMSFNVTVNFVYIGKYLPTTLGKHYEVPWLKDNGAGFGTFNSDPRDGTTNKPDRQGDVGWTAEMPSYTQ